MTDIAYRSCTAADLPALHTLYGIQSQEQEGGYHQSLADFQAEFMRFGFDPTTDLFGAFTPDGEMVGYAEYRVYRRPPVRPYLYGYTHPDYRERGIGTRLIAMGLERARAALADAPAEARVVLQFFTPTDDGAELLQTCGAAETRQSYIMETRFAAPPAQPALPDGYRIVTMADGATIADIAYAHHVSFQDHRGSQEEPLEAVEARWREIITDSQFDPGLYAVVKTGEEIAAVVTANPTTDEDSSMGEISVLGVLPGHRRRGLGLALLHFAFQALAQRGKQGATLIVDAASLTDATRLYRRAGMSVRSVYRAFELELRPGVEITNQGGL